MKRIALGILVMAIVSGTAARGQEGVQTEAFERLTYDTKVNLTFAGFTSDNTYWGLADALIPGFPVDYTWAEGFAKAGITAEYVLGDGLALYGGLTGVFSFTINEDLVGTRDVRAVSMDGLYAGLRSGDAVQGWDISFGSQPYSAGSGMLIGEGAPEGSALGAVTLGPFNAWEQTAILKMHAGQWSADAFYLDANEIYEPDTNTTLAGGKVEYSLGEDQYIGLVAGHVITSEQSFPQAVAGGTGVVQIANGREGMNFANVYGKWQPEGEIYAGITLSGDLGYQWKRSIDMNAWGGRIGVDKTFADTRFHPTFSYNFHLMSGDDPNTSGLERFDPLFNSGPEWAVGGNSSLILSNSNIQVHALAMNMALSERDLFGVKYFHIRSHQVQSPLAIDPSLPPVAGGPNPAGLSSHVADDISVDYTRVLAPNTYLNFALLYSRPADLLDEFAGQDLDDWVSGSVTLTMEF
jgi:hypothetical protein